MDASVMGGRYHSGIRYGKILRSLTIAMSRSPICVRRPERAVSNEIRRAPLARGARLSTCFAPRKVRRLTAARIGFILVVRRRYAQFLFGDVGFAFVTGLVGVELF